MVRLLAGGIDARDGGIVAGGVITPVNTEGVSLVRSTFDL